MTTPPMIAITVILLALVIAVSIGIVFTVFDYLHAKGCKHLCITCKFKKECDWYQMRKLK